MSPEEIHISVLLDELEGYKLDNYILRKNYGWKLFEERKGKLYSILNPGKKHYLINRWLKEEDYRSPSQKRRKYIHISPRVKYPFGFHIYLSKSEAKAWKTEGQVVRKVNIKGGGAICWL